MSPHILPKKLLFGLIPILFSVILISCKVEPVRVLDSQKIRKWVSWQVQFNAKTAGDSIAKKAFMAELRKYVENYVSKYNEGSKNDIRLLPPRELNCACDPALSALEVDIDWDRTDTSGSDTRVPPPPPPTPGVSGGEVEQNTELSAPSTEIPAAAARMVMNLPGNDQKGGPVLAIIDTGIDTAAFSGNIYSMIWQSPSGQTLHNFAYGNGFGGFRDDHAGRHGTQVASLILEQFRDKEAYPQVMVLKAMDSLGVGSTFSVTCALSYAIQNKASLVNMSFGYYGRSHRILKQYIERASKDSIVMVCAAGNVDGVRTELCSTTLDVGHELTSGRQFFPACYSREYPANVITVAGLNTALGPCYYQNYSNTYVTLGIMNTQNCCFFNSLIQQSSVEGSSFATPVATGRIGVMKLGEPGKRVGSFYVNSLLGARVPAITSSERVNTAKYVKNGDFLLY